MRSSKGRGVRLVARARVDQNGRVTIPAPVRRKLRLQTGDELTFAESEKGVVLIRKHAGQDISFMRGLESTLSEWNSAEDDEAFRDL